MGEDAEAVRLQPCAGRRGQAQVLERPAGEHDRVRLCRLRARVRPSRLRPPRGTRRRSRPRAGRRRGRRAPPRRAPRPSPKRHGYGAASVSPASSSSSIAAWPSYVTVSRTPSSAATASKRRPMPEERGAFTFRLWRTTGQRGNGTGRPASSRYEAADAPGLADRRLAARQRHGLEPGDPLEAGEVAAQQLAAPERPVGAVAGAVEDERQRRAGLAVLGQARGGVRVVVLHADELRVLLERPLRREVVGVEVVGDRLGAHAEHREVQLEVGRGTPSRRARCRGRRGAARGTPRRRARRRTCSSARRRRRAPGCRRCTGSGSASGA